MLNLKRIALFGITAILAVGLWGCGNGGSASSGPAAATVNGVAIPESTVTQSIESFRTSMGLEDQDEWGKWLAESGYTPESYRQEILDGLIDSEVLRQAAKDQGVTLEQSEVDDYYNSLVEAYGGEDQLKSLLEQSGMTEDQFRSDIENSLLEEKVQEAVAGEDGVATDEQIVEYYNDNRDFYDGAKRSSAIFFDEDDADKAPAVLAEINSGSLSFADAAKQYSVDSDAEENGGDMGWDILDEQDDEYIEVLEGLQPGQVSNVIEIDDAPVIIMCTEEFAGAKDQDITLDAIPETILEEMRDSANMTVGYDVFEKWLADYKDGLEIEIVDIPTDVSYYVDMSKYAQYATDAEETADALEDELQGELYEENDELDELVEDGDILEDDSEELADIEE